MRCWPRFPALLLGSLLLLPWPAGATPAAQYTIQDLGVVLTVSTLAKDDDRVVGTRREGNLQRGLILGAMGNLIDLLPDGLFVVALGIDRGSVVGYASTGPLGLLTHGFDWNRALGIGDLGTLGGPELFSAATDHNGTALISGYAEDPVTHATVAVLFRPQDPPLVLPLLGGTTGFALGVSDAGLAVGSATTAAGVLHATLWAPPYAAVRDLQQGRDDVQLSGARDLTEGAPEEVDVVGTLEGTQGTRGFRWQAPTGMVDLAPLPGDTASQAYAVNQAGDVVGASYRAGPLPGQSLLSTALLWATDNRPLALQTRLVDGQGWVLERTVGINTAGQIAGIGVLNGEPEHAFLLTPVVPSPAPAPAQQRGPRERGGRRR